MKILIIEDEPDMSNNIAEYLRNEHYVVEQAFDYATAMDKLSIYTYACVLLDVSLPGGSGLQILQNLKKEKKDDGVIIISAKGSIDDRITGLELGADDYLSKPFHLTELLARIRSVLRRRQFEGNNYVEEGNVKVDITNRQVFVNEIPLNLNRKEYNVLWYLLANKNRLVNKMALAEHVWGDNADLSDNFEFVYSQIKNLRKKLRDAEADIEIEAIYGIGYKLEIK